MGCNNNRLPMFEDKELKVGKTIGCGSFCNVREVKNIELMCASLDLDQRKRLIIANKCKFGTSYVVKKINNHDKEKISKCIQGLAMEAKLLSTLDHPHIMKLTGISVNDFNENSFLIMERLGSFLEDKFDTWSITESNLSKMRKRFFDPTGKKKKNLILQKLLVAYNVSSSMAYLHNFRIMHRDLKPDNIGFNMRGQLQLFDFGLAKKLPGNENYKLTGGTGTIRYMAPEVINNSLYGLSADVWSFGVVLWQIMSSGSVPYNNFSVQLYKKMVVNNGYRLALDPSWSCSCSDLISRCWSGPSCDRPTFEEIKKLLQSDLENLGWKDAKLKDQLAKSTSNYDVEHKFRPAMVAGTA